MRVRAELRVRAEYASRRESPVRILTPKSYAGSPVEFLTPESCAGECPRTLRFSDKVRRMSKSPENVREHSEFQIKSGECPKVRRMSENTPIFR